MLGEKYKKIYKHTFKNDVSQCNSFIDDNYMKGVIPNLVPDYVINSPIGRQAYITKVSFPVINKVWVHNLANIIGDKKVIEVMAGSGILSYALRKEGVNVVSTSDNNAWTDIDIEYEFLDEIFSNYFDHKFCEVENLDAVEAVSKYGKDVDYIIMSWPPYKENIALEVLKKMLEVNPNCSLIYIGEDYYGCTASNAFFEYILINHLYYEDMCIDGFQSFYGIYDNIYEIRKDIRK